MSVHGVGDLPERLDVPVVPQLGHEQRRHQRARVDVRGADDDQADAAAGALLVVRRRHVGEEAVPGIGDPGRARGREDDPVLDRRVPDLPLGEEVRILGHGVASARSGMGRG